MRTSLADIKSRKEAKTKKQFARFAGCWFLGAQIFFAAPYTWFERLVPSQGKATKKSGEYEGMVEHIQNLEYLPQIIHTGTLQFQDIGTMYYQPILMMEKKQCKPQSCSAVIPSCGKVTALVGSRRGKPSFPRSEQPMESIHSRKRNDKKICKIRQKKSDNKKRGKPHFPL